MEYIIYLNKLSYYFKEEYMISEMIYYTNTVAKSCNFIPSVKIGYYELTFVLKGTMTYTANDKCYVLKPNDAILL